MVTTSCPWTAQFVFSKVDISYMVSCNCYHCSCHNTPTDNSSSTPSETKSLSDGLHRRSMQSVSSESQMVGLGNVATTSRSGRIGLLDRRLCGTTDVTWGAAIGFANCTKVCKVSVWYLLAYV